MGGWASEEQVANIDLCSGLISRESADGCIARFWLGSGRKFVNEQNSSGENLRNEE